ncbi:MAG: peptidoglycan/xylan/chitin deacetylase (PgdA/CDA1 family) [Polaribacter sp.]
MATIFMYHAVGNEKQIQDSDPHYAVSERQFCEHISIIKSSVALAKQLLATKDVTTESITTDSNKVTESCITFDDGHLSNYLVAFPLLKNKNLTAEFYVNTSMVGKDNFMTWEQLKEMNNEGMSIQSHGHTHGYFSDMNEEEITHELKISKSMIESNLGNKVVVFAPPGGRTDKRVSRIAKSLGYLCVANSRPGLIPFFKSFEIPRFAILKHTNKEKIIDWQSRWSIATIKEVIRYYVFRIAKYFLGNQRYDKIRLKLLGASD